MINPEHERHIRHRVEDGPVSYISEYELAHGDVQTLLNEVDRLRGLLQSITELTAKTQKE